ncbi:MAG: adenylate kinase [Firmicutes bacterium]|nr:adenylate kinase [candidate division NPL-UPA2 bacterium]MBT9153551.1 adenylate kinase [candidate division NPL-UPA2 bacterium]
MNEMNVILLGAPGAGKGTQAAVLCKEFSVPHISTGDMFRQAVQAQTPLGLSAKSFMERGELVPDEVTIGIVAERLAADDTARGFLLDGFPRTLPQAGALDDVLGQLRKGLTAVLNIEVPEEELIRRLTGRQVCKVCGATYHRLFHPSSQGEACGLCGGALYQRVDDSESTVRSRLLVYSRQTTPLIEHYRQRGLLKNIDGLLPIDVVTERLRELLRVRHDSTQIRP